MRSPLCGTTLERLVAMLRRFVSAAAASCVVVGGLVAAAGTTPASAAAPSAVLVGVGSDTTQDVMHAMASSYTANTTTNVDHDKLFSINATGGPYSAPGDQTCPQGVSYAANSQPNGSSAGITALTQTDPTKNCLDFARSSRAKQSGDASTLLFRAFAKDAVTWSAFSGGHAPANLSQSQLQKIYTCQVTNWSQVGGTAGTIVRYLPPTSSGTRTFFVSKVLGGVTIPSTCRYTTIEENRGSLVPSAQRPNAILPYSVARWRAQANGVSTDYRAGATLRSINGVAPTSTNIANNSFLAVRHVYNVTRTDTSSTEQAKLTRLFGNAGYLCTNSTAKQTIVKYGFVLETSTNCGKYLG
jgi:ABC-type phosphate transport system substrate-binding protein